MSAPPHPPTLDLPGDPTPDATTPTPPPENPTPETPSPETTPHPVIAHLDTLVAQLRQYVPAAFDHFDTTAIHQARVATRRLSAALALFDPLIPSAHEKPFRRRLRKLRRRLGPHRDLDVLIGHLDDLATADDRHTTAARYLAQLLRDRREDLRRKALERPDLAPRTLEKLDRYRPVRDDLLETTEAFPTLIAAGANAGFDEFSTLADLLAHQLSEGESLGAIDPHQLRIAGKHLRYALELAEVLPPPTRPTAPATPAPELPYSLPKLLKQFKGIQDALGLWHDHVVLAETATDLARDHRLAYRDARLAAAVASLTATAFEQASTHLSDFARLWSERGQDMALVLRTLLPCTRHHKPHPTEWPPTHP